MIGQHVRQALYMLKETPLVSAISIMGTALAIALVMVMIMLFQIKIANYVPETKRDHSLYITSVRSQPREGVNGSTFNSAVSYNMVKDYLYDMKTPQLITAFTYGQERFLSTPTKKLYAEYYVKATDVNYWKFFKFKLLEGGYFDAGEYDSGLPIAVISQEVAELLYSNEEVIGNSIEINNYPHRIVGVVENASNVANDAFAHVWVPITSGTQYTRTYNNGTVGDLMVIFRFSDSRNKAEIRKEVEDIIQRFSDSNSDFIVTATVRDYIQRTLGAYGMENYLTEGILMILFLLLLPAINLTGITMNNIRQRSSEIGIRKVFGASKGTLLWQIIAENLVITAIGAAIGYLLSFFFIHWGRSFLLSPDTLLTTEMLFRPFGFFAAVFFCLVMNLLSAGLPAWQMSRRPVIKSINDTES